MKEKSTRTLLMLTAILFTGSLFLFANKKDWFGLFPGNKKQQELQAASAIVEQSVQLFYTIDYRKNPDEWVSSLCQISTSQGCEFATFSQSLFWDSFLEQKVITTIEILDSELIQIEIPDCDTCELWKVEITPGDTWTGLPAPGNGSQEVYIQLEKLNDNWFLDHILFDEEVQSLTQEADNE